MLLLLLFIYNVGLYVFLNHPGNYMCCECQHIGQVAQYVLTWLLYNVVLVNHVVVVIVVYMSLQCVLVHQPGNEPCTHCIPEIEGNFIGE